MVGRGGRGDLAERALEAVMADAAEVGFDNVRMHRVAERLGVPLTDITALYPDVDSVGNAWFVRARDAMLAPLPEGFEHWPAKERLFLVITRWLDALAPHREVTGQILRAKAWPSHPHHWMPMVFGLSGLVHWMLDAARIEGEGIVRQVEEVGTTALVLATLRVWLRDDSPASEHTRDWLRRRLDRSDRLMARLTAGRAAGQAAPAADS
jgi:AcrR family transcriptional regulator